MDIKINDPNLIGLFKKIFQGRQDVVARYWKSKKGKSGYSPLCGNEWKRGICNKPCRNCENADYIPLSNSLLMDHFKGNHILGVYPLLKSNKCHFIAADFDNHSGDRNPLEDVKSYYEACEMQDFPVYALRSKSGKGYHSYIFFKSPVPALKARIVAFALLQEAKIIGDDVELPSFDRFFPNQDKLTGKGFGNLIALPFQGEASIKNHTLFLDPNTGFITPFSDRWDMLANLEKVLEAALDELIDLWDLKPDEGKKWNSDRSMNESVERIIKCDFIKWCRDNPEQVNEPLWYALISNLASVRPRGYSLCHEFSKGHPGYTKKQTDEKIHQALDASGPHTCEYLKNNGFKCNKKCDVKSPVGLLFNHLYNQNGDPINVEKKRIKISIG